jgi:hypothetical protein
MRRGKMFLLGCVICVFLIGGVALASFNFNNPIIPNLVITSASTVPSNGDTNPYGVAFVPQGFPSNGLLKPGDILVSNFNNSAGKQGTGTTIVQINPVAPLPEPETFFQGATTPGLSLVLGFLRQGYVVVGNVPSLDGSGVCQTGTVGPGVLQFLDKNANVVLTLTNAQLLNGPWGLAIRENAKSTQIFVANVLSGTVTRLNLSIGRSNSSNPIRVISTTQIASGYTHGCAGTSFVAGPAGLAYDKKKDVLYVSSTQDNAIYAVKKASSTVTDNGTGSIVIKDATHLHGPIGLLLAPNGDFISAQGDVTNVDTNFPSEIVEFTPTGDFVAEVSIDPAPGGAFGIALASTQKGFKFAAVDDNTNTLAIWNINSSE